MENTIRKPSVYDKFNDKPLRWVSVGESHSASIASFGGTFCSGNNEDGQCGTNPDGLYRVKPETVLSGLENVDMCQVHASSKVNIALAKTGDVYSWGLGASISSGKLRSPPSHFFFLRFFLFFLFFYE